MDLTEIRPSGPVRRASMDAIARVYTYDPNSRAGYPVFVLAEKGAPFDFVFVDIFAFEESEPPFLAVNPEGAVPAVVHDGRLFNDSVFMCEYLDAALPGPSLMPDDPALRYQVRLRCRRSDDAAQSVSMYAWHRLIRPTLKDLPADRLEAMIARNPTQERRIAFRRAALDGFTDEQVANARNRIAAYVHELDGALTGRTWLAGDAFTLADIISFANFYAVTQSMGDAVSDATVPAFMVWLRRCYGRPALMESMKLGRSLSLRAFDVAARLGVAVEGGDHD